jgi:hypothetical protein
MISSTSPSTAACFSLGVKRWVWWIGGAWYSQMWEFTATTGFIPREAARLRSMNSMITAAIRPRWSPGAA